MADRIIVYLNEEEQYTAWRNIAPNVPLMTSLPEKYEGLTGLKTYLGMIDVQVLDNLEIPALVEEARKQGVAVWLDVQSPQEGPASWDAALQKGVAGLQTDHPEALIRYLKRQKLR